ncbi:MAG: diguanylate cyclase [Planctomycetota bacterium]
MLNFLEKLNKLALFFIVLILVTLIGVLDYFDGSEISLAFFYLIPLILMNWYGNLKYGITVSILSTIVAQIASHHAGELSFHPLAPYWNLMTRLGFFLVVSFLLSKLKTTLEHERSLSRTDDLTGVANRRAFYEFASKELDRAHREQYSLTIAYLDLDNFKEVNDHFTHLAGDSALQIVAKTITSHIRSTDLFARLGGDEFVLLLPKMENAQTFMSRIHEILLSEMRKNNWPITFSIGVLTCNSLPENLNEFIGLADQLMYQVKETGKNRLEYKTL